MSKQVATKKVGYHGSQRKQIYRKRNAAQSHHGHRAHRPKSIESDITGGRPPHQTRDGIAIDSKTNNTSQNIQRHTRQDSSAGRDEFAFHRPQTH